MGSDSASGPPLTAWELARVGQMALKFLGFRLGFRFLGFLGF